MVGDIIREIVETNDSSGEFFNRRKLEYCWSQVVGPAINQATIRRYVEGDVLHVYLSSAAIKSELAFMKDPLIRALNDAAGSRVISKIVIH